MIRLEFQPRPSTLTNQLVEELTEKFKADKTKSVWKRQDIKTTLLSMSSNKCCYCECRLEQEGKYMQVEHFHHKDLFEDKVLEWENLLPACMRCNTTKNDHNVVIIPLIHPAINFPKNEICFGHYRLYGKTELGKKTIRVIQLNDDEHLVDVRFQIGKQLIFELDEILEKAELFDTGEFKQVGRLTSYLNKIMKRCIPSAPYSATTATILLNEPSYQTTKTIFQKHNLWTTEFQNLEQQAQFCALDLK